ncbi:hypothetical protein EDD85DRAFT_796374 [Armillaria nabsnona]|nr:hypothetical protein EDD85DRAFT_796374 [Armillaria nabsnona]
MAGGWCSEVGGEEIGKLISDQALFDVDEPNRTLGLVPGERRPGGVIDVAKTGLGAHPKSSLRPFPSLPRLSHEAPLVYQQLVSTEASLQFVQKLKGRPGHMEWAGNDHEMSLGTPSNVSVYGEERKVLVLAGKAQGGQVDGMSELQDRV